MTRRQLQKLVDEFAPVVREYVAMALERELRPIRDRLGLFDTEVKSAKLRLRHRGEWEEGRSYQVGDAVIYRKCLYAATLSTTDARPGLFKEVWKPIDTPDDSAEEGRL